MTVNPIKRLFLIAVTVVVVVLMGISLLGSLSEPQITDRLQLYETDLLLHVSELKPDSPETANLSGARAALLGKDPIETALGQYQEVRRSAETNLKQFQVRLQQPAPTPPKVGTDPTSSSRPTPEDEKQLQASIQKQQDLLNQLDLRIGLLQTQQNKVPDALQTWMAVEKRSPGEASSPTVETANVLDGLWSEPPRLFPNAEQQIQKQLEGWFRYKSLARLYQLQQRTDALASLQTTEQAIAQQTLVKLALVSLVPAVGALLGIGLLVGLGLRWLLRSKQPSPTEQAVEQETLAWTVPWNWEVICQVLVIGFVLLGQFIIPYLLLGFFKASGFSFAAFGSRAKAAFTLTQYLMLAASGLLVLYLSIKPFFPLPEGWFRLTGKRNWFAWGLGGYFVALPLMFAVSLVNQQIWHGQGGSNPLLQIVLEEGDGVALAIFFFTAAVAAPVFEELLFRGFLLPSLTRYFPVWGAIAISSLIFAIAHLSLSEVLPLAVLGTILGFVYTRSRGLLASMLLHSLWNSVTMIGLFILGSGAK
jgi:membrane protease YdiL (CAAX protease family)